MLPSFDPDTHPLPSWLIDRTLLQLYAPPPSPLLFLSNVFTADQIREASGRHWMGDTHAALQGRVLGESLASFRSHNNVAHLTPCVIRHASLCRHPTQVCHRTFQFSYRYMSMKQRRVYRSNLEVVRLFPPLSDALRNELSRIRCARHRPSAPAPPDDSQALSNLYFATSPPPFPS
jgi:hypothetical protein